jgi:hypothetical protein
MLQKYLIPGLIVTVAAIVGIMFVDKEYTEIVPLLQKEETLDQDLEQASRVEQRRSELAAAYEAFPDDADSRLRALLPESIHPARIILDVQKVAEQSGVRLDKPVSDVTQNPDDPNIRSTSISFDTSATYDQLHAFLSDLERSLTLRSPVSVSITQDTNLITMPGLADNPILNVKLKFESYAFSTSAEQEQN